jgi:pyruvate/2-oxoglutarate dehydrogenase complex dihydrolipoamide acyltransferase (E2) component
VDQISLSLTIDHQAIDGAPAARFLQTFVNHLETHPGENPQNIEGEE